MTDRERRDSFLSLIDSGALTHDTIGWLRNDPDAVEAWEARHEGWPDDLTLQEWLMSRFRRRREREDDDRSLGLDRSVCLRDVVEFLRGRAGPHPGPYGPTRPDPGLSAAANFIEREFTQ